MPISIYNTLSRQKEPFTPIVAGKVGMYLCGPTVYKPSHLGHAVGPVIFDAVKRFLVHRGYAVTWLVNITDVDDKLIIEAANQKTSTVELAERVTQDYLAAMKKLNVVGIDMMPKASEHIGDIVTVIQTLIDKGFAYVSGGDVYFDVSRDEDYGKLSGRETEDQEGQRSLKSAEKRNPGDFALWKAAKPDEPKEVRYASPWGDGRPGWHIECSAMASRYLGETFDIHGGGMDLIFPHHENEVAQSESASGKPFARYWMHNGLTRSNTKKISKSDSSPEMQAALAKITLHNLLAEQPGELIRFLILSSHYRSPIEYSEAELDSRRKGLATFYRLFERMGRITKRSPYDRAALDAAISSPELAAACREQLARFEQAMDDDFNTAGAIAALFELAPVINRFVDEQKLESGGSPAAQADAMAATGCLIAIGRLIGLFVTAPESKAAGDGVADRAMDVLIQVRQHLRKKKDFESADLIRNLLTERKITLEDRPDGTLWRAE
jgi:cysteinyl-tRNA synthetase